MNMLLQSKGLDSCLLEDPMDLFYLSGLSMSAGSLLLTPQTATLFVDSRYIEMAKQQSAMEVLLLDKLKRTLIDRKVTCLAFDSAKTTVEKLQHKKQEYRDIEWVAFPHMLKTLRVIKDATEQDQMRESANLSKKAFQHAIEWLEEGVTELDIAWRYETYCRERGAAAMAFDPTVAFGSNSAFPHHRASKKKLGKEDVILIDVGCKLNAYASDMTRTLLGPHVHADIKKLDEIVKRAHRAALKHCKPGAKIKEIDIAAREEMRTAGMESLFIHSLGHGIGLETHEYPLINANRQDADVVLEEGMVLTIEPGLYLPGHGGVRHEDTVIITSHGVDNLYGDL
ncbi:MAG: aminopeptidase P family protein [Simkania sp.]|nr:aminopeptidase P family protein [Simkania sp.]